MDAFPFPNFFPASQQGFRPEMGSEKTIPPIQTLPQHLTLVGESGLSQDAIIFLACLFVLKNNMKVIFTSAPDASIFPPFLMAAGVHT